MLGKAVLIFYLLVFIVFTVSANNEATDIVVDKVVVYKAERKLQLLRQGEVFKSYSISLGGSPNGHKRQQGDRRTPEGNYVIDFRNPNSKFHLSLHINYPNESDRLAAKQNGVDPGGDIFIHGIPNRYGNAKVNLKGLDWTDGCISLNNNEIKEIWRYVKNGTPIEIRP